jgi:hypothetical protein
MAALRSARFWRISPPPEWSDGTTPTADLATARGAPDATGYKVPDFRHGQQVAPFFFR